MNMTDKDCNACPVPMGTHKPAEAVHQIQEPASPAQQDVPFDNSLNKLGWKMNDFLRERGAEFDGRVFNHMKSFLRECIQQWLHDHPAAQAQQAATAAVAAPDERAAFEAWAKSEDMSIGSDCDGYIHSNTAAASLAWQARAALAATPAAVQTHAEAAAALGINSALTRIRAGNHAEAIEPLEHALRALAATPAAAAPVVLPEPAIPASQGVCCGNFDSGGYYMGQTEKVCCGSPVDAHPAYYTEQQVRALLAKLQALSVTNILLEVVPGADGMGHEVYATSVEDVVEKLSDLGSRLEDYQLGITAAAPGGLPEPWGYLVEGRIFIGRLLPQHVNSMVESEGFQPTKLFTEQQLRAALLAGASAPAGHCSTCNDHGAVGNILTAEPCPDCTVPAIRAQADARDAGRWRAATRNMEINDVAVVIYDRHGNERTIMGDEADTAIDAAIAAQAVAKEGAQQG